MTTYSKLIQKRHELERQIQELELQEKNDELESVKRTYLNKFVYSGFWECYMFVIEVRRDSCDGIVWDSLSFTVDSDGDAHFTSSKDDDYDSTKDELRIVSKREITRVLKKSKSLQKFLEVLT